MKQNSLGIQRMESVTKVVCIGLGGIGIKLAHEFLNRSDFDLVAVIDPARSEETVGTLQVQPTIAGLRGTGAEVAIVATSSAIEDVAPIAVELCQMGFHVVTTCERLAFPWLTNELLANDIDQAARIAHRTVVASGANPGFVMDVLPVLLATATESPQSVTVRRTVDLSRRRPQLSEKMGIGMPIGQFPESGGGKYGHQGLVESAFLCATGVGWPPKDIEFGRAPIEQHGKVAGIEESVVVVSDKGRRISLMLRFEIGCGDHDEIEIEGDPGITVFVREGVHGDAATTSRLLSSAQVVSRMQPGLRLPIEIPAWTK